MPAETGIRIAGLDNLIRTMRRASVEIAELKDAHAHAGEIVAREAERRAPRRTGRLASSVRASRQARRAQVLAGRASVPYAPPIHWGWPARGIAANPFVSEAAQDTEPEWVPVYLADVQAALDRVRGV